MSSITSYSFLADSSNIEKRLALITSLTNQPTDVNKMVEIAHEMLSPVIKNLVKNSRNIPSKFLTLQQFEDTIIASKIIFHIATILELKNVDSIMHNLNFNLENVNITVNNQGLIFVDTALLLQLIDLHCLLEEFIEYIDPLESEAIDSLAQTDSCLTYKASSALKLNRFTIKIKKQSKDIFENKPDGPAFTDFIVLPTLEDIESYSENEKFVPHIDRAKSTGFLTEEETTNITDVHGARHIIEKCICDLERVQYYMVKSFKPPVADVHTDTTQEKNEEKRLSIKEKRRLTLESALPKDKNGKPLASVLPTDSDNPHDCCCSDSCRNIDIDGEDMGICGEDNVVICIKGRTPEEGDVQIIIRQCPECKNMCVPCPTRLDKDNPDFPDQTFGPVSKPEELHQLRKSEDSRHDDAPPSEPSRHSLVHFKEKPITDPSEDQLPKEAEEHLSKSSVSIVKENSTTKLEKLSQGSVKSISLRDDTSHKSVEGEDFSLNNQESSERPLSENDILERLSELNIILPPVSSSKNDQLMEVRKEDLLTNLDNLSKQSSKGGSSLGDTSRTNVILEDFPLKEEKSLDNQLSESNILERLSDLNIILPPVVPSNNDEPKETTEEDLLNRLDNLSEKSTKSFSPLDTLDKNDNGEEISLKKENLSDQKISETDPLKKFSIILPPVSPSKTNQFKETNKKDSIPYPRTSTQQFQTEVDCTRIYMNEVKKLCLNTDQGEELLLTLTVSPNKTKVIEDDQGFLQNLFSSDELIGRKTPKNDTQQNTQPTASPEQVNEDSSSLRKQERKSNNPEHVSPEKQKVLRQNSFKNETNKVFLMKRNEKEDIIPLERTKICSSLEFDVKLVDTKIRTKGINKTNQSILVQLKDIGVDNLLRACRPAKCCRKAILNEKIKKCLPYSPSLKSLPLDKDDLNVINQSLQMSLQKVKNSIDLRPNYQEQQSYCVTKFKVMYSFVNQQHPKDQSIMYSQYKNKLNYYINLLNDQDNKSPILQYDVMYFKTHRNRIHV